MYARFSDHEREKPAGKLPNCGGGEMNKNPFPAHSSSPESPSCSRTRMPSRAELEAYNVCLCYSFIMSHVDKKFVIPKAT